MAPLRPLWQAPRVHRAESENIDPSLRDRTGHRRDLFLRIARCQLLNCGLLVLGCDKSNDVEKPAPAETESSAAAAPASAGLDAFELPKGFPFAMPPKREGTPKIEVEVFGVCVRTKSKASAAELIEFYEKAFAALTIEAEVTDPMTHSKRTDERSGASIDAKAEEHEQLNVGIGMRMGDSLPVTLCSPLDRIDPAALKALRGKPLGACVKYCEKERECSEKKEPTDCEAECTPDQVSAELSAARWACAEKPCAELMKCILAAPRG